MNTFSIFWRNLFFVSLLLLVFHISGFSQQITSKNASQFLTSHSIRSIQVFSPAQKMLTIDNFGNGKLWDLKHDKIISEYSSTNPFALNISPDFKFFYSINDDGILHKIKIQNNKVVRSKDLNAGRIFNTSFSKNGKWLYAITQDKIYKISTKDLSFETQENIGVRDSYGIRQFVFCSINETYASVDQNNKNVIYLYEAMTKKEIAQIPLNKGENINLIFSPNGKYLAKTTWTKYVEIYEVKTGKFLFKMDCERDSLNKNGPFRTHTWKDRNGKRKFGRCMSSNNIIFGNNDQYIFEVMPTGLIYQWDLKKGILVKKYEYNQGGFINNKLTKEEIILRAIDSKTNTLYGIGRKGKFYKYDLDTKKVSKIGSPLLKIQNATYDSSNESLKFYTKDKKGHILKFNTKNKVTQQLNHYFPNPDYFTFELTNDDRFALNDYGFDQRVLFDSKTGEKYQLPFAPNIGGGFEGKGSFSKDEKYFVTQTKKGIYFGNLSKAKVKPELHNELQLTHWKFSDDNSSIIYLTNAKGQPTLKKLNLETQTVETLWSSPEKTYEAIYFSYSPDRKKISLNIRYLKNKQKPEIIIFDQNFNELYRWKDGGVFTADWLDNSTLISYSYKNIAVLNLKTKSTFKIPGKGEHYISPEKKKQSAFGAKGDTFAAISLKKGSPLFIFDNTKNEFWQLDLPCFQNVNFIEISKDEKELLIVFQNSIVARLDLKNRQVIAQYRLTMINGEIVLIEN